MGSIELLRHCVRISEVLAFIIGLFYFDRKDSLHWRYFPFYVGTVAAIELFGWYLATQKLYLYNNNLYRFIGFPVQFIFLFWLLSRIMAIKNNYKAFIISTSVYVLCWIAEYYFIPQEGHITMSISFSVANLILLILVFLYFHQLINSKQLLTFYRQRSFWVSLGILLYYLGGFPYYGLFNALLKNYDFFLVYTHIILALGSLMYLCFSISFIWGKEK